MTLSFNILGFELATVRLDIDQDEQEQDSVVEAVAKSTTRWWLGKIFR